MRWSRTTRRSWHAPLGVLEGLRHAGDGRGNDERLLSWAPDFTKEARITVLRQLADLGIEIVDLAAPDT
jgi:hypothetical protein